MSTQTSNGDSGNISPGGIENYEVVKRLGTGSFGTVSQVRRKNDGKIFVWKEINYGSMSEREKNQLVAEVNILREMNNPFVVRYYDRIIVKSTTKIYIIMEHCAGGDLARVIKKCKQEKKNIDENIIWRAFAQCVVALKDCHRKTENGELKPVLHRDLKAENILLDAHQNIKMGDFGLAKELSSRSKLAQTNVGTPLYMAPEIINEKAYDEKSDIWSLGCLLYELAALRPPFDATNSVSLALKINNGKFSRIPQKYSDLLMDAIRSMLQVDPRRRPSVDDLEALPALQPAVSQAKRTVAEFRSCQAMASREREVRRREQSVQQKEATLSAKAVELQRQQEKLRMKQRQLEEWGLALQKSVEELNSDRRRFEMELEEAKTLEFVAHSNSYLSCAVEGTTGRVNSQDENITTQISASSSPISWTVAMKAVNGSEEAAAGAAAAGAEAAVGRSDLESRRRVSMGRQTECMSVDAEHNEVVFEVELEAKEGECVPGGNVKDSSVEDSRKGSAAGTSRVRTNRRVAPPPPPPPLAPHPAHPSQPHATANSPSSTASHQHATVLGFIIHCDDNNDSSNDRKLLNQGNQGNLGNANSDVQRQQQGFMGSRGRGWIQAGTGGAEGPGQEGRRERKEGRDWKDGRERGDVISFHSRARRPIRTGVEDAKENHSAAVGSSEFFTHTLQSSAINNMNNINSTTNIRASPAAVERKRLFDVNNNNNNNHHNSSDDLRGAGTLSKQGLFQQGEENKNVESPWKRARDDRAAPTHDIGGGNLVNGAKGVVGMARYAAHTNAGNDRRQWL